MGIAFSAGGFEVGVETVEGVGEGARFWIRAERRGVVEGESIWKVRDPSILYANAPKLPGHFKIETGSKLWSWRPGVEGRKGRTFAMTLGQKPATDSVLFFSLVLLLEPREHFIRLVQVQVRQVGTLVSGQAIFTL